MFRLAPELPKTPQSKPRKQNLLIACFVAFAILILLLRLFVFVHGHSRRTFQIAKPNNFTAAAYHPAPVWTDSFADGTPDFLRLTDPADRAAFRQWFTLIADYQAIRPKSELPAEITDCAGLLRYSYREALKRHDDSWFLTTGIEVPALPGEIHAWHYPNSPLGAALFRIRPGSFAAADATNGAFAQFADAKTLVQRNAYFLTRDVRQAQPGDLLTRSGSQPTVVYDTGPDHNKPGELRRVTLAELLDHPLPQWRPLPSNPNFLGVYRWNILRGTL